jgi:caffeoyl-CoA O-methyltransferase
MADGLGWQVVQDYLKGLVPPRPAELQKMESYAIEEGFPIIGPVCGQVCYQIARMIGARQVFELGSGYGYSRAVPPGAGTSESYGI